MKLLETAWFAVEWKNTCIAVFSDLKAASLIDRTLSFMVQDKISRHLTKSCTLLSLNILFFTSKQVVSRRRSTQRFGQSSKRNAIGWRTVMVLLLICMTYPSNFLLFWPGGFSDLRGSWKMCASVSGWGAFFLLPSLDFICADHLKFFIVCTSARLDHPLFRSKQLIVVNSSSNFNRTTLSYVTRTATLSLFKVRRTAKESVRKGKPM